LKKKEKNEKEKEKKEKVRKKRKKKEESTVNYCCNPQCFVYGGTMILPHHLDIVNISIHYLLLFIIQ